MNKTQAMRELKSVGTAQNREVYPRHGVQGELFGVSYANLEKLRKKIGTDHALARALWATANHDARILASMIADPAEISAADVDAWVADLDNYVVADAFVGLVARSPLAHSRMKKWVRSKKEFVASAGWGLLAQLTGSPELSDDDLLGHLQTIESKIHAAPNHARHSMNQALICIGVRGPALRAEALAAAKRVGVVEVDHGQTSCKTPDAADYIRKTVAHQKQMAARRKKKKKKKKKKAKAARRPRAGRA